MTTKELLKVLNNTRSMKLLELARNPLPDVEPSLPEVNWEKRKMEKNKIMTKYLKIIVGCFVGIILFMSPVFIAYPDVAKSFMMGLPPMVFMALSWMIGAWYAWDKEQHLFMAVTIGAIPVRFAIGLMWTVFVLQLPNINAGAFCFGMMLLWIVFTIPEFSMLIEFSKRVPRINAKQIEP